jgi:hypothetical protein
VLQQRGWRTAYLHNGDMDWGGQKYLLQNAGMTPSRTTTISKSRADFLGRGGPLSRDRLIRWIDEKPGTAFHGLLLDRPDAQSLRASPGCARYDFYHGKPPRAHPDSLARYLNVLHEADAQLAGFSPLCANGHRR